MTVSASVQYPPSRERLVHAARRYLADASNSSLSTHGRYGAAMNALGALCVAGLGDEHDEILLDLWEASRYDVDSWPNRFQVAIVVFHVAQLLRAHGKTVEADYPHPDKSK